MTMNWKKRLLVAAFTIMMAGGCGSLAETPADTTPGAAVSEPSQPEETAREAVHPPAEPQEEAESSTPEPEQAEQEEIEQNYYMDHNYTIRPKHDEIHKKVVLLTFDDAPKDEAVLSSILDTLEQFQAKAIFFVNGYRAEQQPELLKLIADKGHLIGNHSWDHVNLKEVPAEQLEKQIGDVQRLVEEVTGEAPLFFRPPHGAGSDAVRAKAAEHHLLFMNWSNGSRDWMEGYQTTEKIIDSVLEQLHSGSNILMHELPWTAEALGPLLTVLQEKGYGFVHPASIDIEYSKTYSKNL